MFYFQCSEFDLFPKAVSLVTLSWLEIMSWALYISSKFYSKTEEFILWFISLFDFTIGTAIRSDVISNTIWKLPQPGHWIQVYFLFSVLFQVANFLLLHNKNFFSSILQKIVSHFTSSPLTASWGPIILLSIACAPNPCHQLYLEFYFSYKFLFHTKLPLNIGPYIRAGLDLIFPLSKGTLSEVTSWHSAGERTY